jgi:hypothetical protein
MSFYDMDQRDIDTYLANLFDWFSCMDLDDFWYTKSRCYLR